MRDGTVGLRAVHEAGGLTMVQNPAEAEYPDMPRNAMSDLPVTFCLDLAEIGPALDLLVRRTAGTGNGVGSLCSDAQGPSRVAHTPHQSIPAKRSDVGIPDHRDARAGTGPDGCSGNPQSGSGARISWRQRTIE